MHDAADLSSGEEMAFLLQFKFYLRCAEVLSTCKKDNTNQLNKLFFIFFRFKFDLRLVKQSN